MIYVISNENLGNDVSATKLSLSVLYHVCARNSFNILNKYTWHRTRIRQSQEVNKETENNENCSGGEETLRGRIRRKSIIFNNSIGKQLKSSLKRTPTQMMRTKVVLETSFLNHSSLQFRVQPLTFQDDAAPCMI